MSRVIAVCAVTGQQGRSVAEYLVKDGTFCVRGLARDPTSESAKSIAALGIEVIKANLSDPASLDAAFQGVECVYAYTVPGPDERQHGFNVADAAKKAGVRLLVWSSSQSAKASGPYDAPTYEDKAAVWEYIQKLYIPSVQLCFGLFLENFTEFHWLKVSETDDKEWIITVPILTFDAPVPVVWVKHDLGRSALVIFKHYQTHHELVNETFAIAHGKETLQSIGKKISAATSASVTAVTLTEDVVRQAGFGYIVDVFKLTRDGKLMPGLEIPSTKLVELGLETSSVDEWVNTVIKPFVNARSK